MTSIPRAKVLLITAVTCVLSLSMAPAQAIPEEGALIGKFKVRCPLGHDDEVSGITRNNTCKVGGKEHPRVVKGTAMVVCPDGHPNPVANVTKSHKCWIDDKECAK